MTIALAQTKPFRGNISLNINAHIKFITRAIQMDADIILFPELSLTGYEPRMAKNLVIKPEDSRLKIFQHMSNAHKLTIILGAPVRCMEGINISLLIFQPDRSMQIYAKQKLHPDELPYFVAGQTQTIVDVHGKNIAPAICYESLDNMHCQNAKKLGADFYLVSVAKSEEGCKKAGPIYSSLAKLHSIPVLMANFAGTCEDFDAAGTSSIWSAEGKLLEQLSSTKEGIIAYDVDKQLIAKTNLVEI
ncbi:putative amidohydrolase [Pedobacter sp. AK017]|uniref:carbon-nitrogen hydrolase family protein n=1 Tax=Pedobacter sp. AK017 TaxID=2723073 RepID=UPI00160DD27D|nr:carbon-nitrogen hydrolase family protein [Pedobacter sp. AK017]MBB5438912.1 putative amidohydrolase [Pedobacter sp. AK017]